MLWKRKWHGHVILPKYSPFLQRRNIFNQDKATSPFPSQIVSPPSTLRVKEREKKRRKKEQKKKPKSKEEAKQSKAKLNSAQLGFLSPPSLLHVEVDALWNPHNSSTRLAFSAPMASNPSETPADDFLEQILGFPSFASADNNLSGGDGGGLAGAPPGAMMLQLSSGDGSGHMPGVGGGGVGFPGSVFPLGLSLEQGKPGFLKPEEASGSGKRFRNDVVDGRASTVKNVRLEWSYFALIREEMKFSKILSLIVFMFHFLLLNQRGCIEIERGANWCCEWGFSFFVGFFWLVIKQRKRERERVSRKKTSDSTFVRGLMWN